MAKTTAGIRAKRFKIKSGERVTLFIETELGEKFELAVTNGSLTGVAAESGSQLLVQDGLSVGKILPESKIKWTGGEASLGRLVLRSMKPVNEKTFFGFSLVDTRLPLMGELSRYFEDLNSSPNGVFEFDLSAKKFTLASFLETDQTNVDLFHKCREYGMLHEDLKRNPLWQYYAVRHETKGLTVKLSLPTIKKPTSYVNFGSYDYFGFSSDPEVKEAAVKAIEKFGVSATATPPLSGRSSFHEELEMKLAQILRKDDCLLFSSGFAANVGALTAILTGNDLVIADILSHASIHDGVSASKAKARIFRHNSNKHLRSLLEEHRDQHAGALAVTEGLFSMDGDAPDLKGFVQVAKDHQAKVFLDEVHSFGVMGETGLGAAEMCGVLDDIDIYTGSLSKGMGAGGGFVAGSKEVTQWMRAFARTEVFSSALSPSCAAAALKSVELMRTQPERRKRLHENIAQFLDGLKDMGYEPKSHVHSPIVPVIIGDTEKMGIINKVLIENGVFCNPIVFPAVPVHLCRMRFSISAAHTFSEIQMALNALKRGLEVAGIDFRALKDRQTAA